MKGFINEFKDFALRGNVMALAVGVIIGGAFQGVVTSLTDNIISPVIGTFAGMNFDALSLYIGNTTIRYGAFITSVVNFAILSFIVFLITRGMNKLATLGTHESVGEAVPQTLACPYCMSAIHPEATRCPSCTSQLRKAQ